jgi:hypothetical protein
MRTGVERPDVESPHVVPPSRSGRGKRALEATARKEPSKERTPRVDQAELLRKTFDFDVLA